MDTLDLIYLNNYNSNFLEDFKNHLLKNKIFELFKIEYYNENKIVYHIQIPLLSKEAAIELYDITNSDFTISELSAHTFKITNLLSVQKLFERVVNESEYTPSITNYSINFYYDALTQELKFSCTFELELKL